MVFGGVSRNRCSQRSSDPTPLIQGLLGTSRTFIGTPPSPTSPSSHVLVESISHGKSSS
jgi:hypothetical protein